MYILLQQMLILFLLMLVGFWVAKKGILDEKGSKILSAIVVEVANPALTIKSGLKVSLAPMQVLRVLGIAVTTYLVLIILSLLLPKLLRVPKDQVGAYRAMTVFSNIGFMGVPLVSAMYGAEAVLYVAIFMIIYNILIYTYGVKCLGGKDLSLKKVLNLGVISSVLALAFAFMDIPESTVVGGFFEHLGNLTAPLSMIVIGASFVNYSMKELFLDLRLDLFTLIKMLILPTIGLLFLRGLGMSGMMLGVMLVMISTPVGSMTAMLANQYDGDVRTATRGVAITTLLAVVTMSLVSFLLV